jgi:hypothetical protein
MQIKGPYLSRTAASEYLQKLGFRVAPSTLAKLAVLGGGPPFIKFMSRAFYETGDLDAWLAKRIGQKRISTSTAPDDNFSDEK